MAISPANVEFLHARLTRQSGLLAELDSYTLTGEASRLPLAYHRGRGPGGTSTPVLHVKLGLRHKDAPWTATWVLELCPDNGPCCLLPDSPTIHGDVAPRIERMKMAHAPGGWGITITGTTTLAFFVPHTATDPPGPPREVPARP